MTITLADFLADLASNLTLFLTVLLTLGVILVNGWTDAPNAIATCVSTRSLSPRKSVLMAAFFNFLGVWMMTAINASVAQTIYRMADFRGDARAALVALCAAMVAIVVWATAAWWFGIPTSEGHALIAGVSGAAIALQGGLSGINGEEWIKVVYGLFLSVGLGFGAGFGFARLLGFLFRDRDRRTATPFFRRAQVAGSAAMAFMHGAQDGQKFMGVFLLGVFLAQGEGQATRFLVPTWLMVLVSVVMAIGTSAGGYRIIKTVGMDMVKLEPFQGFAADTAAAVSLLASSLLGFPVSTTHAKTTAIMGVGIERRVSLVKWSVVKDMGLAWALTFPGCGLVGYLTAHLFLKLFQ
ncbi:inorganic phosphate transporter [Anaerotalea alkaliphila]|uniref:Inorganic phosphate transporter n=1 Tax=Anaerotalea alkaliphila TaxID=2662126 RepID=A0A7X5KPC0_9FIRM|nr:inorganic phosphate transporter [Anaerotalea alkaliphila]NDL67862.1 inorganic phosphate transporter [Anaerotalea alkaliphila]